MFPFDSVFYHLVLFAFNCLIFKELSRPLSHRLCLATAFIYYHVLNPLSTLFFKLFSFLFFSGDRLADDFAILPPPYPFCQHLFSSSFDFFLSLLLSHSLHSFIFFIFLLVAGVWFSSGCYLAGIWRSSGYNLAPIWFLLSFFHPLHRCTAAFYFGSGYFGTYYLYKKIPLFYKQNLFIAVIYFLEP